MNRLTFIDRDARLLEARMFEEAPLETGAFFLLRAAASASGTRMVASEPYFPVDAEWDSRQPHRLVPGAKLLSAMVGRSMAAGAGLLFVHTHPAPGHPVGFSETPALRPLNCLPAIL